MAASTSIELPPLNIQTIDIPVIGDSPLISHAWSAKAKKMMLDKHMKKAGAGRVAKDPFQDFAETLYWLDGVPEKPTEEDIEGGRFGFPAIAFKAAAVTAVTSMGGMTKVMARQCFHIVGEFVELQGPPPSMRFYAFTDLTVGLFVLSRCPGHWDGYKVALLALLAVQLAWHATFWFVRPDNAPIGSIDWTYALGLSVLGFWQFIAGAWPGSADAVRRIRNLVSGGAPDRHWRGAA